MLITNPADIPGYEQKEASTMIDTGAVHDTTAAPEPTTATLEVRFSTADIKRRIEAMFDDVQPGEVRSLEV